MNLPSPDILIKLAEAFDVTLDYLAIETKRTTGKLNIQDRELLRRFEMVDNLSEKEITLAKEILDLRYSETSIPETGRSRIKLMTQ